MVHLVFACLHIAALLFAPGGLLLTIPLHLIFAAIAAPRRAAAAAAQADAGPQRRCPECRELVRADARKCKHCGSALQPEPAGQPAAGGDHALGNTAIAIGAMVLLVILARACS